MNSIKNLVIVVLLAATGTLKAQDKTPQNQIDGTIRDENQRPLDLATVSLIRAQDSTLFKTALTDEQGKFIFKSIPESDYKLVITQIGHQKHTSASIKIDKEQSAVHLAPVTLKTDSKQLKEVNVTVQKPLIERRGDKLIINVENSSVSAGSTALEVLQKAPGITLDKDDNVALKGKGGVLIMIDGKPTYLSSADLASMLRNMQSNEIEAIEIISNPSARYEAEGKSGIINIRLKKNKNYGTNGTLTAGGGYSTKRKANAGISLNNRNKKLNLFGNYNYNNNKGEQVLNIDRVNSGAEVQTLFSQKGKSDRYWYNNNFKVGADFSINKNNTIGAMVNGYINEWNDDFNNITQIRSMQGTLDSSVLSNSVTRSNYRNLSYNLNFKSVLDTLGRELSVDLDYADNYGNNKSRYDNDYTYTALNRTVNELIKNRTPSNIDIYSIKLDYTHPFSKSVKMEAGFKVSWVKTDNDFQFNRFENDQWNNDPLRSNHFVYDENVNAGYVNLRKEYKNTNIQVGLRVEQTNSKGNLITTGQVVKRDYLDFFPSAALNHNFNENNSVGLTYSRRISRPGYDDLNPFENYLDRYTYNQGNPFLKPEYTNTYELSYTLLKKYTASIGYTKTTDVITQVILPDPERSALFQTNRNLAEQLSYSFNLSIPFTFTKWWSSNTNFTAFNNQFKSPDLNGQVLDNNQSAFQVYHSQSFTISSTMSFEASGNYQSEVVWGTLKVQPQYAMDLGLNKSFFKKKINVKAAVNDVFNTRSGKISSAFPGLDYKLYQKNDTRTARLTLSYKFGNNEVKPSRKRETGLDSEAGRVKN